MSGRVGDLSLKQEETLKEFRNGVSDILTPRHDDYFLLRWLRARNFNKKKSEAMLRKHMEWRKEIGVDTLLTKYSPPEVFLKYYPGGLLGQDKEGCPVRYVPFGVVDFEGFLSCVFIKDYIKYLSCLFEEDIRTMEEHSQKTGKVIETHTYILDMKDLSMKVVMSKKVLELFYYIITTYQDNYPERLKKAFVINATGPFFMGFNLLKPFMNEYIISKYHIHGTTGFQEALLEDIDAEVLPQSLGGKKVDPDGNPACPSVNKPGGTIPETYYMKAARHRFCDLPDVKKFVMEKKTQVPIEMNVEHTGATIKWEFLSVDYDIGMGLFKKVSTQDENMEVVLPRKRVECHHVPEKGTYVCNQPGLYVLQFDNNDSWFRSKEVIYKVEVEPPSTSL